MITDKVKSNQLEKTLRSKARALSTEANRGRKVYQFRTQTRNVFGEVIRVIILKNFCNYLEN